MAQQHLIDESGYLALPAVWRFDPNCTTRVPKIVHMTARSLPAHVRAVSSEPPAFRPGIGEPIESSNAATKRN